MLAVVGAIAWLAAAAAERPSTLSPPTIRVPDPPLIGSEPTWFLGPLHGLLPGLTTISQQLHKDAVVVLIVVGVGWALAWAMATGLPSRVLLAASAVAQALLVLAPPLPLTDVFNYELYGRMAALHGLNPYRALPAAASNDPIYGSPTGTTSAARTARCSRCSPRRSSRSGPTAGCGRGSSSCSRAASRRWRSSAIWPRDSGCRASARSPASA